MKKALSLILAVIMVMSLVACGGKNDTANNGGDKTNTTDTQKPDTSLAEKDTSGTKVEATEKTEDATYAEEVTIAVGVADLDPGETWNSERELYQRFVFDSLLYIDDVTGERTLTLAKTFEWTDDTCTAIHVVLKDDVVFSNGDPVTSADVEFSFGRNTYTTMVQVYDHLEILSDKEFIIHLKMPYVNFPNYLSRACGSIVCKAEAEKHPDGLALIGSGPYKYDMDTFVAANSISVVKNDKYWGEPSPTQKVNFVKIADKSAAAIALQKEEINFMIAANQNEIPNLNAQDNVTVAEFSSYGFIYMGFNDKCDTTAVTEEELNFRRAVACAINRDDIIAGLGGGDHCITLWPYDNPAYIGDVSEYEYDLTYNPERAKEYRAKAGGRTELNALVDTSKAYVKVSAQIIQEHLRQVGITLNIEETDSTGFSSICKWGIVDHDVVIHNNLFSLKEGGYALFQPNSNPNRALMASPEVSEIIDRAMTATTQEAQAQAVKDLSHYINRTVSYLPLTWRPQNYAYTTGLENFVVSSGPCYALRDVALRTN